MFRKSTGFMCALALSFSTVAFAQTDTALTSSVKTKLAADDTVKANQIDVSTDAHVVTLAGVVDSKAARERALTIARETTGVTSVVDKLTVKDSGKTAAEKAADGVDKAADKSAEAVGTAAKETGKAVSKGAKETGKAVDKAATKTADAVSGESEKAKDSAAKAGSQTAATLSDAEITTAVKTKLLGDGKTPGLKIDVDTKDGVVTLSGDVASATEKSSATTIARGTKGVKGVVNKLTVAGR